MSFVELLTRARELLERDDRGMLGICGAPGSGKSTLAARLGTELGDAAVVIGMDGFHLAQRELERRGIADRKGAPDTFDAAGYVALLARIRDARDHVVYAPEFRREIEEPVAGAVAVAADTPLVITEGNYLLLDRQPWRRVRELLDEVWFLRPAEPTRLEWLVRRHMAYGRTREQALARAHGSDGRNAELIVATASRADRVITDGYSFAPVSRHRR